LFMLRTGELPSFKAMINAYSWHRYDLNALFRKQSGFMTVNVQGLSRVCFPCPLVGLAADPFPQGMFIYKALYWGIEGAKRNYALQIRNIVVGARKQLGEVPIVIGECGVPMDLKSVALFLSVNV